MRGHLGEKRMPTLVGIFLIAIGIFATSYLVQNVGSLFTKASLSDVPQSVKVTNITSDFFTVSWITSDQTTGSVSFWKEEKQPASPAGRQTTALDDRDKPENIGRYKTHHVTVKTVTPQTKYFFKIQSGKDSYDDDGNPYAVTTAEQLDDASKPVATNVEGSVVNEDGSAGGAALVYVNIEGSSQLSTQTATNGKWGLPLILRTSDLKEWFEILSDDKLDIFVTNGQKTSKVQASIGSVIPSITVGQDYNFVVSQPATSSSETKSSFVISPTPQVVSAPKLNSPKEGEGFTDTQPRFSGTAHKGSAVKITIQSEPVATTVKADSNGNWSFRPQTPLSPGEHTISISAPDSSGIIRTITRKFQVFAQGSQVEETASPSATPTVKLSPTPTTAIAVTATPGASPTAFTSPTSVPIPTKAPKPPPVTGLFDANLPLIGLGALGVITFLIGLALLF